MSTRTLQLSDALHEYLLRETIDEHPALCALRAETAQLERGEMQIAPEQGQFMRLLCELIGARRAVEVGTFTGYSSICVALALPADGRMICCDVSREWTDIARRYWDRAGVAGKIELRLGPGLESLDALCADAAMLETFDFAFIDADKVGSDAYYERMLRLLRPGGVVALDNALRDGRVADPAFDDRDTAAMRAMNRKVAHDVRVSACLVPIGDGLLLARKR